MSPFWKTKTTPIRDTSAVNSAWRTTTFTPYKATIAIRNYPNILWKSLPFWNWSWRSRWGQFNANYGYSQKSDYLNWFSCGLWFLFLGIPQLHQLYKIVLSIRIDVCDNRLPIWEWNPIAKMRFQHFNLRVVELFGIGCAFAIKFIPARLWN